MWYDPKNLRLCLQIARSENVGPATFMMLMRSYASPSDALQAMPELSRRGGARRLKITKLNEIDAEIADTFKRNGSFCVWGAPGYPSLLAQIPDAPPVISLYGHQSLLARRGVAIVGGRNASAAAQTIARRLSGELGQRGWVGISGLARGIDTVVHKAMLASGTIAVIANGADITYPPENGALQSSIMEQGLLICENPIGTKPHAQLFPRRNRIIAGLSYGTLVIEAARRSGSLITARLAAEYGRDVLAVPGSPLDPRCLGSNNLLREGAHLVETAEDVDSVLGAIGNQLEAAFSPPPSPTRQAAPEISDSQRSKILALLGPTPVDIDTLCQMSDLPLPYIYQVLLELDLAGRIYRHFDNKISLVVVERR